MRRLLDMLTPEETARFRALYANARLSIDEIGHALSLSRSSVYRLARALGCPPNVERRRVSAVQAHARSRATLSSLSTAGCPVSIYESLPASTLRGVRARPRAGDRAGEVWMRLL